MKSFIKIKRISLLIISVLLFLIVILFFVWDNTIVKLKLLGDKDETIDVYTNYTDKLFEIHHTGKKISMKKIKYDIDTNLDTNTVGEYYYKYIIYYNGKEYSLERNINVVDNEAPKITIDNNLFEKNLCTANISKSEAKAIDNYDGDISSEIIRKVSKKGITYSVYDSSNNLTEVFKESNNVDVSEPIITLFGNNPVYLTKGSQYKEPGFKATDNCAGNITNNVKTINNININREGNYEVIYYVIDSNGNRSTAHRNVIVGLPQNPEIESKKKEIENYIKSNGYSVSFIYYNLDNGYQYSFRENNVYFGASLIKTVAALYAYEKLNVNDEIRSLVNPTITFSNNTTYSKLVKKIGINNYRNYALSYGITYANELRSSRIFISSTANDQLIIWKKLWNFINTDSKGEELKKFFVNDNSRYLDFDNSIQVMHKYGRASNYYHDVGIIFDDEPYIIIVMTREQNRNPNRTVNTLSKKIYELHSMIKNQ